MSRWRLPTVFLVPILVPSFGSIGMMVTGWMIIIGAKICFERKVPLLLGLQVVGSHIHHGQRRMPKQRLLRPSSWWSNLGWSCEKQKHLLYILVLFGDLPSFKSRHRHRHSHDHHHHLSSSSSPVFWENSRSTSPFLFIFHCRCLGVGGRPHHPIIMWTNGRSRYKCASAWWKISWRAVSCTPLKINMELKHHPIEKETFIFGFHVIFLQGVYLCDLTKIGTLQDQCGHVMKVCKIGNYWQNPSWTHRKQQVV